MAWGEGNVGDKYTKLQIKAYAARSVINVTQAATAPPIRK
jgi:hypothetical protein